MTTVSVIGATGRQGLAQLKCLLESGYRVRALSRSANPNLGAMSGRVEVRLADLEDQTSITSALEGSEFVFHTNPLHLNGRKVEILENVGRACLEANISRLVWNTSSWIPDRPGDPFTYVHNTVGINTLWALGLPSTVFGAVLFMDNLLTDWARPSLINDRRYIYPHAPNIKASWISLDDVAKIMVASLKRPDMVGTWMNIGGPERLNGATVAKTLSEVLGFDIDYAPYTPEEFAQALTDAVSDSVPDHEKTVFQKYITDFYHHNNTSPTRPFQVNAEFIADRFPEVQLETLRDWAQRQDWSDSADRPSGG